MSRTSSALLTHQDDYTKINLPRIAVDYSAGITRWIYGVNSHVNNISGSNTIFSYEKGFEPKNASSIVETINIEHVLRFQGEGIKIIVSDNAMVWKNWMVTVAIAQ